MLCSLVFFFSTFNLTFQTYPLLLLNTSVTLAIGHRFRTTSFWHRNTTSPTQKFFFPFCHLSRVCRDWRNSFLQCDQNSYTMFWTWHYLLWQYESGQLKFPGDGITTLDFMVNMLDGESGRSLVGSQIVSVVGGPGFKIPSASVTNVRSDSSSSDFPCVLRSDKRIAREDLIFLSQTPRMWLIAGEFLAHSIHSPPWTCINDWISWFFVSVEGFSPAI